MPCIAKYIPRKFNPDNLEDGVRDIAINLNKIPGVETLTGFCEGHIFPDEDMLNTAIISDSTGASTPFQINPDFKESNELINKIKSFADKYKIVSLKKDKYYANNYSLNVNSLHNDIAEKKLPNLEITFESAKKRKQEIDKCLSEFNQLLVDFINTGYK